jgi:hypothetical protein
MLFSNSADYIPNQPFIGIGAMILNVVIGNKDSYTESAIFDALPVTYTGQLPRNFVSAMLIAGSPVEGKIHGNE